MGRDNEVMMVVLTEDMVVELLKEDMVIQEVIQMQTSRERAGWERCSSGKRR